MVATPLLYPLTGKRVFVAGHRGMVGSALIRRLETEGCGDIITAPREALDLTQQSDVLNWMRDTKPEAVFLAAAKVGGIHANDTYPAEFLQQNLLIASNIIDTAYKTGVEKLLFLGSSCIYPREAAQPMTEEALLSGPLEPTNQWYAIAKIAGLKLCQAYRKQYGADFISAMPTNLYGPGDNYHPENSHVIPGLLRRAHEAKQASERGMTIWGTGAPRREFMYVDDCADALVFLMKHYSEHDIINVGTEEEVTIEHLTVQVMNAVGLAGDVQKDLSKSDGMPRKLMCSARLKALGWRPKTKLGQGLSQAYAWYVNHNKSE